MQFKSVKGFTGWAQIGILCVYLGAGLILTSIVQILILGMLDPSAVSSGDPKQITDIILKPENVGYARLIQVLGTFFLMFLPAVFWSLTVNGKNPLWLGFSKYVSAKQIAVGFALIFIAGLLASPLAEISKSIVANFPDLNRLAKQMEDAYNQQVIALSNLQNIGELLMAIIIMAFLPALFEEMLFRGVIQNLLTKWWKSAIPAIIVSAIIFSIIHMSVYLFASRILLGVVLGLMFFYTKNIWVNVIAHFLNNFLAVLQLYYNSSKAKPVAVEDLDPSVPWWLAIAAAAGLIFLFKYLIKISQHNRSVIVVKEEAMPYINPFQKI